MGTLSKWLPSLSTIKDILIAGTAIGALFFSCRANQIAERAAAESNLNIKYIRQTVDNYSPMTLPNSIRIFDPPLNYVRPNPSVVHELVVVNNSDVVATEVSVFLTFSKPLVLALVALDPKLHPRGHWNVISDNEHYEAATVKLGLIPSDGKARLFFVYSHPSTAEHSREFPNALKVIVSSPSQKSSVERVYSLAF